MNSGDTNTPDRLERALQASLRPLDPGADFTAALAARLAAAPAPIRTVMQPPLRQRRLHAASLALAASIVVALTVGLQWREVRAEQQAQQQRIHIQLLLALEITSESLGHAQQRIEQYQSQENRL
jgi:uncharacterized SAM-binding protein YcdF (DUF218 family)